MRIQQLVLENFRGFEKLEMDFPDSKSGLTVFVGVNGAGKTTILDSIAYLLNGLRSELYEGREKNNNEEKKNYPINLGSKDVKHTTHESKIRIEFNYFGFELKRYRTISYEGFVNYIRTEEEINQILSIKNKLSKSFWEKAPIFSYFPSDRTISEPELKITNLKKFQPHTIYDDVLSEKIDFIEFFDWFRSVEDFESEQIRFQKDINHRDKRLNAIRKAIQSFLPNYSNFRVQRQPYLDFILEKNGTKLSVSSLSHGEKLALVLFGDIARRLATANPNLENPIEGKGVILIDEIEMHLHPSWQRRIISALTDTFPNVQFIVTTHSPQIISTVQKENVFILEDFKIRKFPPFHTFGKDSNTILEEVFETESRPESGKKAIKELYQLIDNNDRKNAEKKLIQLKKELGETDTELVRAEMYIELMDE